MKRHQWGVARNAHLLNVLLLIKIDISPEQAPVLTPKGLDKNKVSEGRLQEIAELSPWLTPEGVRRARGF